MALDTQGGLNTLATSNQPQVLDESAMVEEQATPKTKVLGTDLLDDSVVNLEQQKARLNQQLQKMIDSYGSRTAPSVDPQLAALSEGLGSDTPYFSVAFGKGIGSMAKAATEEERQRREDAKLRLEMMQTGVGLQEKQLAQDLLGRLYKTNEKGELTSEIDPAVASKLSRITGDPKYQQMVISDLQTKKTRESFNKIFPTTEVEQPNGVKKSVINFNPAALGDVVKSSSDPAKTLSDLTDTIKKMRQSGLLGDQSTRDTPFDAISLFSTDNPEIQKQAKYYAEKYKQGLITDEEADKLASKLETRYDKGLDREDKNYFKTLMLNLQRDQVETRKAEMGKKLTDEQKIAYRQIIVPVINEGTKATTALQTVDAIRTSVANAPSGFISGYFSKSVGRVLGTDANTALRELEAQSKRLMTQIPRLPGAQSNFDAENLEKSLGKLADPTLTNSQRVDLLNEVEAGFKKLQERSWAAQDYWDEYRDVAPEISGRQTKKIEKGEPAKGGAGSTSSNIIHYDAQGRRIP